jgi:hypothetical protein
MSQGHHHGDKAIGMLIHVLLQTKGKHLRVLKKGASEAQQLGGIRQNGFQRRLETGHATLAVKGYHQGTIVDADCVVPPKSAPGKGIAFADGTTIHPVEKGRITVLVRRTKLGNNGYTTAENDIKETFLRTPITRKNWTKNALVVDRDESTLNYLHALFSKVYNVDRTTANRGTQMNGLVLNQLGAKFEITR